MNFEFTADNIIDATFIDDERDLIEIIYMKDKRPVAYNLQVRASARDFQHLMTIMTMDEIEQRTIERIASLYEEQREIIKELIESGEIEVTAPTQSKADIKEILRQELMDPLIWDAEELKANDGADALFEIKLRLFDEDSVISAPIEVKEKIRLSESVAEMFYHLYVYRCSESTSPPDDTDPA